MGVPVADRKKSPVTAPPDKKSMNSANWPHLLPSFLDSSTACLSLYSWTQQEGSFEVCVLPLFHPFAWNALLSAGHWLLYLTICFGGIILQFHVNSLTSLALSSVLSNQFIWASSGSLSCTFICLLAYTLLHLGNGVLSIFQSLWSVCHIEVPQNNTPWTLYMMFKMLCGKIDWLF